MEPIETTRTIESNVPARPRRGPRAMLAALILAGAIGVIGVGATLAADESADPSASPSTTTEESDGSTNSGTDSSGEDCPERSGDTETDASSS